MFEESSAKEIYAKKLNQQRVYDSEEFKTRNEEAYKRFIRKPYYLVEGVIKRGNQQDGCADNGKA